MQSREREDMKREEISLSLFPHPLSLSPFSISLSIFSFSLHFLSILSFALYFLSIFSLHFLSILSFALHFLFIFSFSLHFLGSGFPASLNLCRPGCRPLQSPHTSISQTNCGQRCMDVWMVQLVVVFYILSNDRW